MKTRVFSILLSIIGCTPIFAQTYLMSENSIITTCSGTLYDSGGANNSCQPGEHFIKTIYSGQANSHVLINIEMIDIYMFDTLRIYDGPDTNSPPLQSNYAPVEENRSFISTGNCITIEWVSTYSYDADFAIGISCKYECIAYTNALFDAAGQLLPNGSYIDVCHNSTLEVSVESNFQSGQNGNYPQSATTTEYTWLVYNDTMFLIDLFNEYSGMNLTDIAIPFDNPGVYMILLKSSDFNTCQSNNLPVLFVRVPPDPIFEITGHEEAACEGQEVQLTGYISPVTAVANDNDHIINNCIYGCYEYYQHFPFYVSTSSNITTLQEPDDLSSLEVKMEHSAAGDLEMLLMCPSGKTVRIFDESTCGGKNYGIPTDDDNCVPGVGWTYYWSDEASISLQDIENTSYQNIPAGSYRPVQTFDDLYGCPVNGEWQLIIMDNRCGDDGFIFSANIHLKGEYTDFLEIPEYPQNQWSSQSSDNSFWTGYCLDGNSGNTTSFTPNFTGGGFPYVFHITDNFGCVYDTTIILFILDKLDPQCCPLPEPHICYVTSSGLYGNLIRWGMPQAALDSVYIYREEDGEYHQVAACDYAQAQFTDYSAQPWAASSNYKISFINNCSEETVLSSNHRSVYLQVNSPNESTCQLIWNEYFGLDYSVTEIYRGISPYHLELLTSVNNDVCTFTDDNLPEGAEYCYYRLGFNTTADCSGAKDDVMIFSNIATNNPGFYGMGSNASPLQFEIYPNPASGKVSIQFTAPNAKLSICDLNGKTLIVKNDFTGGEINIEHLKAGVYMVKLETDEGVGVRKLIVE